MNSYITSNYYYDTYAGILIPHEEFEKYAKDASSEVRIRIMNKPIKGFEVQVQDATCAVAEILYNQSQKKLFLENIMNGNSQIVTSEKVGDYSKSYTNVTPNELLKEIDKTKEKIDEEVQKSLFFTGLLYSGIRNV